ncbi:YhcN/YlaJ family sporulation lipoprotein [Cohnella massiliensis]|uniref:YhcN/YlaJ family sporulation lipoprotein n=1 Tax=Cohnella massiliensis TaxID=1816691 RepID=UPI0009BAD8EE|nr:YhcN/YlaJ family sporulation lipoprotein [Cohnella massiliensis]
MRKGLAASTLVLSAALALSGCAANQGDLGNKNIRPNNAGNMRGLNNRFANDQANEMNRIHGTQQMNNNVVGLHGNTNMELSDDIANKLAALPEIKSAYVMLTDRNAYVAITEETNGRQRVKGTYRSNNGTGRTKGMGAGMADRGVGMSNPNSVTPRSAAPYRSDYYSVGDNTGTTAGGGTHGGFGRGGANSRAGTNGRVGAMSGDASDTLKNKVGDLVKGMSPTTENVYVSTNPDFFGRMERMANDFRNGNPIQGMITEFNTLVERIFPEQSGMNGTSRAQTAPNYMHR